jgi:hypothetical protein
VKVVGRSGQLAVSKGVRWSDSTPSSSGIRVLSPMVERYVSRSELAGIMGVSLATVDRMVAEGMPSVTWGRRTRRFRPSDAISWASERRRAA